MEPTTRERIASKTIPLIRTWFEDAFVEGFDPNREIGKTDPKDRHVASAAAAVAPSKLVTLNTKHFDFAALADLGVAVQTPDEFLCGLFDGNPELIEAVTREAATNLSRTLPSWDEYLTALSERHGLPKFVGRLRSPTIVEQPTGPVVP
jgi:hypothetical protein